MFISSGRLLPERIESMHTVVDIQRARERKFRTGNFKQQMRTGVYCDPKCPPGQMSIQELAASRGQSVVPGRLGECKWNILPLTGTLLAAATTITLEEANSPIGICVEKIVVLNLDAQAVQFRDLLFGNSPQWIQAELYDQNLFRPDGRCSACCLPMQCLAAGTRVTVVADRIPDVAVDADIRLRFYLIGPSIGV